MPDREMIDTTRDKRYVRRDEQGEFKEVEDVGRSSANDQRRDAENDTRKGQGDRGDRKTPVKGRAWRPGKGRAQPTTGASGRPLQLGLQGDERTVEGLRVLPNCGPDLAEPLPLPSRGVSPCAAACAPRRLSP